MSDGNANTPPASRKTSQVLLRALAKMSLDVMAQALGKDDSTASRVRSGEARVTLSEVCELIDAAGLKLVPTSKYCVDRARWEAITTIAAAAMSDKESVRKLVWEEE